QRREPAARAACARPAPRPVGAPRGGRADPRTGGARPRVGRTAYAARAAAGPRRGARGAVGPVAALPRRAGAESGVTRLALEEVTFWYPATRAPALREVSLAARDPITLSGGELQRVIVAGLLAMDPDLVLLDEPTAELDPAGARSMWRLLRLLAGEGKAIVVATSELDAVPDVADRVVWL